MNRSNAELIYYSIGTGIFAMMLLVLVFLIYTAYTKLDLIVKYLSNCQAIQVRQPVYGRGFIGRMLMLAEVWTGRPGVAP